MADEAVLIMISLHGYIKRVAARAFRTQSRGGRGVTGHNLKEEDETLLILPARTLHTVLFFSDKGKVYSEKVYQLPDAGRTDRGIAVVNILSLNADEKITAAVAVPDFESGGYCSMATVNGRVKRVALAEFASVRPSGLIAISLEKDDQLGWARITRGTDDIILVTARGQALRFNESEIRGMGRQAAGRRGIRLSRGDRLTSMEVVQPDADLLVVTGRGFGKRTPLSDYPVKSRNTGGVTSIDKKSLSRIGMISTARVVEENDEITLVSSNGLIIRMKVSDISRTGRSTRGVRLMDLAESDSVATLARISAADLQRAEAEKNGNNGG